MRSHPYAELLQYAKKVTRRSDEAEDLLQTVLLAAVEAGRADMTVVGNRRWLMGALKKRAAFDARTAVRRRQRELSLAVTECEVPEEEYFPGHFVSTLPPSLRTTALLALTGHSKKEITWLLRLSDCALRQRIVSIKRRWRMYQGRCFSEIPGLVGSLAFGQIRQALQKPVVSQRSFLASHDPDGHLFTLSSQNHPVRQQVDTPTN